MATGGTEFRRHLRRALEVCAYLERFGGADIEELARQAGVSIPSAKRLIRVIREELGARIVWYRDPHDRGGVYRIHDWGYLDRDRVLRDFVILTRRAQQRQ